MLYKVTIKVIHTGAWQLNTLINVFMNKLSSNTNLAVFSELVSVEEYKCLKFNAIILK